MQSHLLIKPLDVKLSTGVLNSSFGGGRVQYGTDDKVKIGEFDSTSSRSKKKKLNGVLLNFFNCSLVNFVKL